jgi:hypothetical protein
VRIAALVLDGGKVRPNTNRKTYDSFGFLGLEIIIAEMQDAGYAVGYCTLETMHNYDLVLWSITAPEDIVTFIQAKKAGRVKKGNAKIVVGGPGCVNICSIAIDVDVAVFGRGEGLADAVVSGVEHESIWTRATDPDLSGRYVVRQVCRLDEREGGSVGCQNKCFFCQYTWTRKLVGDGYNPTKSALGAVNNRINEENFSQLKIDGPGRYTTAWDGLSDDTRKRVNKGFVTDELIVDKFSGAIAGNYDKAVMLKVFNIVGYPWESPESVMSDIKHIGKMLKPCTAAGSGRLMAALHTTPFSPEPLTPMEHVPVNVDVNWRRLFGGKCLALIDAPAINVFLDPYTTTPPTLIRRVLINRCRAKEGEIVQGIIASKSLATERGATLKRAITTALGRDVFGWQEPGDVVPYLSSYADASRIAWKRFPPQRAGVQ